jgi:hypothetical protein
MSGFFLDRLPSVFVIDCDHRVESFLQRRPGEFILVSLRPVLA